MAQSSRVLPHNLDAEKSILGAVLLRNDALNHLDSIEEEDFYDPRHRAVFSAMRALDTRSRPIDEVTLEEELSSSGKLEAIGGLSFLSELALAVPTADNITHYAEIVQDKHTARQLMLAASEIAAKGYGEFADVQDYIEEAETKIFEVTQRNQRGQAVNIKSLLKGVFETLDSRFAATDGITGIPTGYGELDQKTAGLQPSDLIILAARPAMGKTSLAMSIVQNCAMTHGIPVLAFSLEMSSMQLAERMLCSEARIDSSLLRRGQLQRQDMTNLTYAANNLAKAPIYIDDTPALSVREVRAKARRFCGNRDIFPKETKGLIVVDYLQLMRGSNQHRNSNREQEISEISRGLKALAKEIACPVLALSQLNRSLESRQDKRPMLSDLRECVTGDTLVVLADGRREPIASLVGTAPRVIAMRDDGKIVAAESDRVWRVGRRPVFEIALRSGRRIRATAKHRLYGARGWCRVGDLAAGDRLAIARTLPAAESPERWPDARVALLVRAQPSSDLFWDEILSITEAGEEDVYDLTVPGPASWLADGIVSHNSGAIEQDADQIVFIYRDEVYTKDACERPGIAEVIIGKNRHGPVATVELRFEGRYTRFDNLSHRDDGYDAEPPPPTDYSPSTDGAPF